MDQIVRAATAAAQYVTTELYFSTKKKQELENELIKVFIHELCNSEQITLTIIDRIPCEILSKTFKKLQLSDLSFPCNLKMIISKSRIVLLDVNKHQTITVFRNF